MTTTRTVYRLSWEMIAPSVCAQLAYEHNRKDYWLAVSEGEKERLWNEHGGWVEKEVHSYEEIRKQHETLKKWAETGEQPIRRVRLDACEQTRTEWREFTP